MHKHQKLELLTPHPLLCDHPSAYVLTVSHAKAKPLEIQIFTYRERGLSNDQTIDYSQALTL